MIHFEYDHDRNSNRSAKEGLLTSDTTLRKACLEARLPNHRYTTIIPIPTQLHSAPGGLDAALSC